MIILCTRGPIHCAIMYKHAHESRNERKKHRRKSYTCIEQLYGIIERSPKKKTTTSNQSFWVGQTKYQPNAWCDVMTFAAIFNSPFSGSSSTTSVMYCWLSFFFALHIQCYQLLSGHHWHLRLHTVQTVKWLHHTTHFHNDNSTQNGKKLADKKIHMTMHRSTSHGPSI